MRNSFKCSQQNARQVQIFTNHAKYFQIFTNHADTQDHSNHSFIKKEKSCQDKRYKWCQNKILIVVQLNHKIKTCEPKTKKQTRKQQQLGTYPPGGGASKPTSTRALQLQHKEVSCQMSVRNGCVFVYACRKKALQLRPRMLLWTGTQLIMMMCMMIKEGRYWRMMQSYSARLVIWCTCSTK